MEKSGDKNLKNQAISGSSLEAISALTQRIGGLIFTIILARFLLPEGFGLYNLALSITLILFVFAQGGIDKSLARYISEVIKLKLDKKGAIYFQYLFKLKFITLLIISIIFVLLAYPLAFYIFKKPTLFAPILFATLYNFFNSLERFFTSFFFASGAIKYRAFKEIIFQVSRIVLILITFFLIYSNPNINYVFFVLIVSSVLTFLFVVYKVYNLSPSFFSKADKIEDKDRKRILRFTIYLTFTSVSILFLGSIDTLMLGLLVKDPAYVGLYNSAFFLTASVSGLLSFTEVLLPIFVKSDKDKLEEIFNKVFRYLMILAIPTAFGLFILGKYFIVLIYGYDYIDSTSALMVLSSIMFLSVSPGLFIELFSVKERPKDYLPLTIFIIILNILLNFVLIKLLLFYSHSNVIIGAALATVLSWSIYSICLGVLAKKKLKIKTDLTAIIKPLIASLAMVIAIYLIKNHFKDINLFNGVVLVIIGVLTYFISLSLIRGINKEDYFFIEIIKSKLLSRKTL